MKNKCVFRLIVVLLLVASMMPLGAFADDDLAEELGIAPARLECEQGYAAAENLVGEYSVSVAAEDESSDFDYTVSIHATDLMLHVKDDTAGYWCGAAFAAPADAAQVKVAYTQYMYTMDDVWAMTETTQLEEIDSQGNTGIAVYVNATSSFEGISGYLRIQWIKSDGADVSEPVTYCIDISDVELYHSAVTAPEILDDSTNPPSAPYTYYEIVEADSVNKVVVEVRGLKEFENPDGVLGTWIGIAINAPDGAASAEYRVGFASPLDLSIYNMTETQLPEGESKLVFYQDCSVNRLYLVRWKDADGKVLFTEYHVVSGSYTLEDNYVQLTSAHLSEYNVSSRIEYLGNGQGKIYLSGTLTAGRHQINLQTTLGTYLYTEFEIGSVGNIIDGSEITVSDTKNKGGRTSTYTIELEEGTDVLGRVDSITSGDTVAEISNDIPDEKQESVKSAVESLRAYSLENYALKAAKKVDALPGLSEAAKALFPDAGGDAIQITVQPYISAVATSYDEETGNLSLEISAKFKTMASCGDESKEIAIEGASGDIEVDEPITLSIKLPKIVSAQNVYIAHTKYQRTYYYDSYYYTDYEGDPCVQFDSVHGLSPFEIIVDDTRPYKAKVGDVGYASLQDAVDELSNNDVLVLYGNDSAVIDRELSFSVTPNGYSASITAADGFTLSKSGNNYVVSKKSAEAEDPGFTPVPTYRISIESTEGGSVKANLTNASEGGRILLTVTPDEGWKLAYITVNGERIDGTEFTMPGKDVTVKAVFVSAAAQMPFLDVPTTAWYYDAVSYVYAEGMMTGVSDTAFGPDTTMTRAMFWTVLARIDGGNVDGGSPWYAKAQNWAMSSGVSDGSDPDGIVTREMFVTMLWRYAGSPAASGSLTGFPDAAKVSSWASEAMRWAVANGVIAGVDGSLSPDTGITRAQAATIFMRYAQL